MAKPVTQNDKRLTMLLDHRRSRSMATENLMILLSNDLGRSIDCQTQFDLNHPLWPPSESGQFFFFGFFVARGQIRTVVCRSQFDLGYPL